VCAHIHSPRFSSTVEIQLTTRSFLLKLLLTKPLSGTYRGSQDSWRVSLYSKQRRSKRRVNVHVRTSDE
jgi:hypothetical protein